MFGALNVEKYLKIGTEIISFPSIITIKRKLCNLFLCINKIKPGFNNEVL